MKTAIISFSAFMLSILCSCGPTAYVPAEYDTSKEQHDRGYGSVAEKNLTGSVSKVKIGKNPAIYTSIYDYLKGTVAGLEVNGNTIHIRGVDTINGTNEPLFIVDGMAVNDISDISPSLVDSVEVLKDGSTTAAYGSRGGGGVIIIHLKK